MSNKIRQLIGDELFYARERVDFLSRIMSKSADLPELNIYNLRKALKSHGLAVIESDALRVALDQFEIAKTIDSDSMNGFADFSDVDSAQAAILEAWKESK